MENNTPKEAQTPEVRSRKGLRIAIVVIILIIIAAAIGNSKYKANKSDDQAVLSDCKAGDLFSQSTGKPCPQTGDTGTDTNQAASTGPSGYEEAIRMYAGKVVLFDADCKPLPVNPTFKAGTRILVANNSTKQLALEIGGKKNTLDSYHYYTYPLGNAGITVVSCNGAPAVNVTVQ